MCKLFAVCACLLFAACAQAEIKALSEVVSVGTNTYGTATFERVRGEIEAIEVGTLVTGSVFVAFVPLHGIGSVSVYSSDISGTNTVTRPRIVTERHVVSPDPATTNTVIESVCLYALDGENVIVNVSNSETGKVWCVILKMKQ